MNKIVLECLIILLHFTTHILSDMHNEVTKLNRKAKDFGGYKSTWTKSDSNLLLSLWPFVFDVHLEADA